MSGVSLPVSRPAGRCLIVGQPACRTAPLIRARREGLECTEVDDPYQAMAALSKKPLFFSAMVLSLNSLYREELQIVSTIKRRFSAVEIWLSDTDGRPAALAEALRLGADGLLDDEGLHRIGAAIPAPEPAAPAVAPVVNSAPARATEIEPVSEPPRADLPAEPVLTAEELRALLQEDPALPSGEST